MVLQNTDDENRLIRESIQDFQISSAIEQNVLNAQKMHEHYMTFKDAGLQGRYAKCLRNKWVEATNNLNGSYIDISNVNDYPLGSVLREQAIQSNENLKAFIQLFDSLIEDEKQTNGVTVDTYGVRASIETSIGMNAAEAVAWMAFGGMDSVEVPTGTDHKYASVRHWSGATLNHIDNTANRTLSFVDNYAAASANHKINIDSHMARIVALYTIWYKHDCVDSVLFTNQGNAAEKIVVKHFQLLGENDTNQVSGEGNTACNKYGYCETVNDTVTENAYSIWENSRDGRRHYAAVVGALLAYQNLAGGASRAKFFGGEDEYHIDYLNKALSSGYRYDDDDGFQAADIQVVFRNLGAITKDSSITSMNALFDAKLEKLSNLNIHFKTTAYVEPLRADRTAGAGYSSADAAHSYNTPGVTDATKVKVFGTNMVINATSNAATDGSNAPAQTPFLKNILDERCKYAPEALKKMFGNADEDDIDLRKVGLAVEIGALQNNGQLIDDGKDNETSSWYKGFTQGLLYLNRARVEMGKLGDLSWMDIINMHQSKDSSNANKKLETNFCDSLLKLKKWAPAVKSEAEGSNANLSSLDNTETLFESIAYVPFISEFVNVGSDSNTLHDNKFYTTGNNANSISSPLSAHLFKNSLADLLKQSLTHNPENFNNVLANVSYFMKDGLTNPSEKDMMRGLFNKNATGTNEEMGSTSSNNDNRGPVVNKGGLIDFNSSNKDKSLIWHQSMIFLNVVAQLTETERLSLYVEGNFELIATKITNLVEYKKATQNIAGVQVDAKFEAIYSTNVAAASLGSNTAHQLSQAHSDAVLNPFPLVSDATGYKTITGSVDGSWFVKVRDTRNGAPAIGSANDYIVNRDILAAIYASLATKMAGVGVDAATSNRVIGRMKVTNNEHLSLGELMKLPDVQDSDQIKDFDGNNAMDFSSDGFTPTDDSNVKFTGVAGCKFAVQAIFHVLLDIDTDKSDVSMVEVKGGSGADATYTKEHTSNTELAKWRGEIAKVLDDDSVKNHPSFIYAFLYNLTIKSNSVKTTSFSASSTNTINKQTATLLNALTGDFSKYGTSLTPLVTKWPVDGGVNGPILKENAQVKFVKDLLSRITFDSTDLRNIGSLEKTDGSVTAENINDTLNAQAEVKRVAGKLINLPFTLKDVKTQYLEDYSGTAYNGINGSDASSSSDSFVVLNQLLCHMAAQKYGNYDDYLDNDGKLMPGGLTKAALDALLIDSNGVNMDEEDLKEQAYLVQEREHTSSGRAFKKTTKAIAFAHLHEANGESVIGYGTGFEEDQDGEIAEKVTAWEA